MAKLSYEKAYKELEELLSDLKEEKIAVDKLADKIKRASELIKFCKDKLRNTEEEIAALNEDA